MATQAFYIEMEDSLIEATKNCHQVLSALNLESLVNDGYLIPENRDVQGTLYVNARALLRELELLTVEMGKHWNFS